MFSQKLEQLMQIESGTSGELLLPVSKKPSHRDKISQRNNGAPLRNSNRTSPWWFTWQTVALVLYSWIPTHTMLWRHHHWDCTIPVHQGRPDWPYELLTIREASQAESMSEAINNKVKPHTDHHLGSMITGSIRQTMSFFSGLESCVSTVTYNSSAENVWIWLHQFRNFIFSKEVLSELGKLNRHRST